MTMILNEWLWLLHQWFRSIEKWQRRQRLENLFFPQAENCSFPLIIHQVPSYGERKLYSSSHRGSPRVWQGYLNTMSFLPFGTGPWFFVGQSIAMMESKVTLLKILQRYSFMILPGYAHAPISHITTRPQYGVEVILRLGSILCFLENGL